MFFSGPLPFMPYRLQQDEPLDAGIKRVAEEQVTAAISHLQSHNFYQARKNLKKVRAILRLLKPRLGPVYQEDNRRMRDAARRFSASRDADVSLEVLETFAPHYRRQSTLDPQRKALREKRQPVDPAESMQELDGTRKRIEDWPLHGLSMALLEAQMAKTHRQSRHSFLHARKSRTAEDFHEFRKSVKREVNQLRLLAPDEPKIRELKKLSDLLGDHHNLAVMLANLENSSGRFRQMARRKQREYEAQIVALASDVLYSVSQP